jgi:LPXTG-motif cell wall-anchored protein
MVRTNEGGSVLSFVVVGVILAILMVSGVVLVRQQSINSHKPAPAPQKVVKTDKNPTTTPAPSGGSTTPAPQPKAPSSGSTTTPAPNKELPHTGPAETAMTVLGLGLLTASSVAYLRSRRSAPLAY